jgi:hypothetical protein
MTSHIGLPGILIACAMAVLPAQAAEKATKLQQRLTGGTHVKAATITLRTAPPTTPIAPTVHVPTVRMMPSVRIR